jgi:hypothetical protein
MDWHDYVTGKLVEARLEELRTSAARTRLLRARRPPQGELRVAVGRALIRLGSRIVGTVSVTVHNSGH